MNLKKIFHKNRLEDLENTGRNAPHVTDIHADCGYVEGHLVKYTLNAQIGKRHRKEVKRGKENETKRIWLLDFH